MNFWLYPFVSLAVIALSACSTLKEPDCLTKIRSSGQANTPPSTCSVSILPTTINNDMVYVDSIAYTKTLPLLLTDKIKETVEESDRLTINTDAVGKADYVLKSHVDEFIVTDEESNDQGHFSDRKEVTLAITYDLVATNSNKVIFSNQINYSAVKRYYSKYIAVSDGIKALNLTINTIDGVNQLFSYNLTKALVSGFMGDVNLSRSIQHRLLGNIAMCPTDNVIADEQLTRAAKKQYHDEVTGHAAPFASSPLSAAEKYSAYYCPSNTAESMVSATK